MTHSAVRNQARKRPGGQSNRGITLIELVVVTVVISTLGLILMNFMIDKLVQNARLNAEADLQLQAKLTLDTVNSEIKHSTGADDTNRWEDENAPVAGDPFSWTGDDTTLILARVAQDADGNILFQHPNSYTTYKDNIIYFRENNTLYKRILAADAADNAAVTTCPEDQASSSCPADPVMAENVDTFTVTYFDNEGNEVTTPSEASSVKLHIATSKEIFGKNITGQHTLTGVFRGVN